MINRISHSRIYVTDQDEALDFYVGKLGMEVSADVDLEVMRWRTVRVPGNDDHNILLEKAGVSPYMDEDAASKVQELIAKGAASMAILSTDDCRATFDDLVAKGVEVIEEPVDRFYGIDCAVRDPFGNHIRITEEKEITEMPAKLTADATQAAD